ncbi:MAG TPA: zf-HC2 domain-containing protein, partial [Myxococcaceae bacterium]|nr:zf-HC2 domain-containing protein [Myxococcaceae bacterium]
MRPPVPTHPDDDRLLELAYGEAPASEARVLRQHVDGCARCRKVLEGIAEVRSAFRSVPAEPAPERGLESLLAYGEQAAARARSRRGGLRVLALLSAATAFALVWLVLPSAQRQSDGLARAPASPASKPADTLAQAETPATPAQGDRARDEFDDRKTEAKDEEKKTRPAAPVAPMAKAEGHREEQAQPQRRLAGEPAKQKEL